jgi:uncharacterized protein (TIGR02421 family)
MNKQEINDKLIELSKQVNIISFVAPINDSAEKRKFFSAYKNKEIYNPQYRYNPIPLDLIQFRKQIREIKTDDVVFQKIQKDLLKKIKFIEKIGTEDFNDTSLYGKPKKSLVKKAKKLISRKKSKKHERPFTSKGAKEELKACFKRYEITDWNVSISNSLVSKAEANHNKKTLTIKRRNYSLDEIKRLEVHEIETHILRSINGLNQRYNFLGMIGMPGYLKTEEGLATIMEEDNNVLSEQTLRFYCARIIAVDMAMKKSFYDIFKKMHEQYNLSRNNAYVIAKRAKRGLSDTSLPGGLIRDHIYFEGREELKRFIKKGGDIRLLFAGKIGLKDLHLVEEGNIKYPIILPNSLRENVITKSS